jgi:hypothetical protein
VSRFFAVKVLITLALSLALIPGCASILPSLKDCVVGGTKCRNESPGGTDERVCINKYKQRLSAEHRGRESEREGEKWRVGSGYQYKPPEFRPYWDNADTTPTKFVLFFNEIRQTSSN